MNSMLLSIAIVEHQSLIDAELSVHDLRDRLDRVWIDLQTQALKGTFTLEADGVLAVNARVANACGAEPGPFLDREGWHQFVQECGSIDDDPAHVSSWIFSALYWKHLSRFRLATTWLFVNALRVQHGLPAFRLALERLGAFLESLSGSGPPLYDGQTFDPADYS